MKTHIITKDQLDADNNYIGSTNLDNFEGHLESEENLGYVKFKFLKIQGYIGFKAGSGIKAGDGIEAGGGIKAGCGIEAGGGIEAGSGIEAGGGIKAGGGIEAGSGIEAGWGISAKTISSKLRIFAGLCLWRLPTKEECQIRAKLLSGTIAFGELVEPVELQEVKNKVLLELTDEQLESIKDIINK